MGAIATLKSRSRNFAALIVLVLCGVPQAATALPEEIRKNACAPSFYYPISQSLIDGTLKVDVWGTVASIAAKHVENDGYPDFFEDQQIKAHILAVMQQSFSFRMYPDDVVEDYIAGSSDPVLKDEIQQGYLRDQATKFTHLQKLLEEFFKLQVNDELLKYALENYRSDDEGRLKLAESRMPRDEGFAYIDERYAHHLSKGHTATGATFRAFFDLHNHSYQKYNKWAKGPKRLTGRLTNADDVHEKLRDVQWLKVNLIRRALDIPGRYAKADRRLNPWGLFNWFLAHYIIEDFLPDFAQTGGLTNDGLFTNKHCPINDNRYKAFATAKAIGTDFFVKKGSNPAATPQKDDPEWCGNIVSFAAVTAQPGIFMAPKGGETATPGAELDRTMKRLTMAAKSSCPGLKQVQIDGYMVTDKRRLYSAAFLPSGDGYLRAVAFADPYLPLYFRAAEGDGEAMFMLSIVYQKGGLKDRWQGRYWRFRSAQAGFAPAQAMIAAAYGPEKALLGQAWGERNWLKINTYKGIYWAKKAAEQGDPLGMWNYSFFLKLHHLGGIHSPDALAKMLTYQMEMGMNGLELMYKGDKYKEIRREALNRVTDMTAPLVEAAAYSVLAAETCKLDHYRSGEIHGPGCQSVIDIYRGWKQRNFNICEGQWVGDICVTPD